MSKRPVVDLNNILLAAFVPISFCQKITNLNLKHSKDARTLLHEKAVHEMLVKLIETCVQFHQHFTSGFCTDILLLTTYYSKL